MDTLEVKENAPFFRRIDWASFWTATALSFVVYFLTLGPSVGLEDSGELAVAGDHLGVPHPPGYPIWTIISFCLARVFSFVTFRGQPNPAWAIALGSAIFGALAAGCTAMLITRSASDMMAGEDHDPAKGSRQGDGGGWDNLIAYVGGVAGSLIFAFSPVMWSQSTIVEVYSLGAFFLMLVMLLTYRWMRRPSDKLLWVTAFVFGLGLTNYQVLLLAALPLVVILFLRNIALFRDFVVVMVPFGLACMILKLGALNQQADLPKRVPLLVEVAIPNGALVTAGVVALGLALAVLVAFRASLRDPAGDGGAQKQKGGRLVAVASAALVGLALFLLLLAGLTAKPGVVGAVNPANVTLLEPLKYLRFAWLLAGVLGLSAWGAAFSGGAARSRDGGLARAAFWGAAALALVALAMAAAIPAAVLPAGAEQAGLPTLGVGLYDAGFALGLVVMVALAATTPRSLTFALPMAAIEATLYILVRKGAMMGLTHPSTWWFCAPAFFNFAMLAQAALALPNGASVAMTVFASELGLSFYVYMPIVSDLRNPPMNWGYPRTWEGFKHAITRGQYEAIKPTNIFTQRFIHQVGDYFIDLRRQFTLLLAPFGFLPFAAWKVARSARKTRPEGPCRLDWRAMALPLALLALAAALWGADAFAEEAAIGDALGATLRALGAAALVAAVAVALRAGSAPFMLALGFIAVTVLFVVLGNIPAIERAFDASRIDKLFMGGLLLLGGFGGLCMAYLQLENALRRAFARRDDGGAKVPELLTVCGVALALGLFAFAILFKASQAATGMTAVAALVAALMLGGGAAALRWLSRHGATKVGYDDVSQQWLLGTVCNFLVMSVLLIMLANPKGDLQDAFIQKVKFIASHGLFALWIGYGLALGLAAVKRWFCNPARGLQQDGEGGDMPARELQQDGKGRVAHALMALAMLAVFLTPLIPIEQNYFNDRLVFELSGAEQNGHDYGWQFGNYQLRGAEAIREELEDDEEPLPNPLFPPEMGQGAVFFGGTDPGRFVPTYMIYSADVRPDVFLITQNALADNTFMSVTRDLYGDQLWIPTPKDSEEAFGEFVEDVRSGKRQANSDIVVENGRVQVVGALGVMEINGILCEKIFEHNKRWHDFYVEESYVIPWMYPYLTPHGLIMKINAERTPLTKENVDDDLDFWDWYVRRMTRDGRYRRDIVAQKSFSKLRSAIAGLYMARGRVAEGERAYNDARVLYPVSPEATFRYVQDVLMRQRRYDEALEAIGYFCERDPNNDRGPYVKGVIEEIKRDEARLAELMGKAAYRAGLRGPAGDGEVQNPQGVAPTAAEVADALEIAGLQLKLGSPGLARDTLAGLAEAPGLSVADCMKVAAMLDHVGDTAGAARAMDRVWRKNSVRQSEEALRTAIGIYENAGDLEKLEVLLPIYLKMRPDDWQSHLVVASLNAAKGRMDIAAGALEKAVRFGGDKVAPLVEKNPTLMAVYRHWLERQRGQRRTGALPGAPGAFR